VKTGVLDAAAGPALAPAKPLPAPAVRPVEILFKPSPIYTEEARRLRVEGEVVLSVVFQADGTLRVLGVLQSLGHGLDQMAEQAASQIRFKPAEQAGKPTDFAATLRIEFRLA
jgi:TonB family protein